MKVQERSALKKIAVYRAAKTIASVCEEYGVDSIVRLAGNESRLGTSPKAVKALKEGLGQLAMYPDTNYTLLREKLQKIHQVEADRLIFGNGSFELLSLVGQAYLEEGDETIISQPTFNWYQNVTLQMHAVPVYVPLKGFNLDLEAVLAAVTDKTKIIWICNPNNPTGAIIPADALKAFIEKVPNNILIVLDEAYIDFAEDYVDTVPWLKEHENLILLRTFSKLYGLASLRIGYGIASPEVITNMTKVKLPINVNAAAYMAAAASVDDEDFKSYVRRHISDSRNYYYKAFDKLGLTYIRSNTNFILVRTGLDSRYVDREFLKRGYMIRSGADFGLDDYMRISIGTEEDNKKVIEILTELLDIEKNK